MKTPEEFVVSDLLWEDCVHNPHDTVKRECYRCLAVLIANRDREVAEKVREALTPYIQRKAEARALDLEEVLR